MKYICLDTETTGFEYANGDRIIEIGCVKIENNVIVKEFVKKINPERKITEESIQIHKITDEMVANAPKFSEIAQEMLDFIGDSDIVAHNAKFDMSFINFELTNANMPIIEKNRWIDTLMLSKSIFPGEKANLDALCKRFNISTTQREQEGHNALLDSKLLAMVFIKMIQEYDILNQNSASFLGFEKYKEQVSRIFGYGVSEIENLEHNKMMSCK